MDLNTVDAYVPAADATWRPGDAFLAGGSWLFSEPQVGLRRLLDLRSYGWPSLVADPAGLEIAATCTLAELATFRRRDWPATEAFPLCCQALLGSFKVWNVATVGGNICLALPAGPMTGLAAALDGVCTIWRADGSVTRRPVTELVVGPQRTTLKPGELLRSIRVPASALASRVVIRQMSLVSVGRSAALVIGRRDEHETVLTVTASTQRPYRLRYPSLPSVSDAVADLERVVMRWHDDIHGSPEWRRAMTMRLLAEVLEELA